MRRGAFTLIEIVFAMVVMGIVAMIGTDIITHMYEGYIKSKVVNKLQTRTEQVADMIAKRLEYRIKDSAVASKSGASATYKKLSDSSIDASYNVIEWIGYDNEGMIGETGQGWSGFVDIDNNETNETQILSSGSNFNRAQESITALSNGSKNITSSAIIFKCNHNIDPTSYGFAGGSGGSVHNITTLSFADTISINNSSSEDICEQYYLAWTAYAIVPEGANSNDFNLTLKYDYQPWNGQTYSDATTKSALLAEHVSTFRFIQYGHTLRFKLCLRDPQTSYGFCKERAVW